MQTIGNHYRLRIRLDCWTTSYSIAVRSPREGELRKRRDTSIAVAAGRPATSKSDKHSDERVPHDHQPDTVRVEEGRNRPQHARDEKQQSARPSARSPAPGPTRPR